MYKDRWHKSNLTPIGDVLNRMLKLPKGTEVETDKNSATYHYPSGKKYISYYKTADPIIRGKRCPTGTTIERRNGQAVITYPSGKKYTVYAKEQKRYRT